MAHAELLRFLAEAGVVSDCPCYPARACAGKRSTDWRRAPRLRTVRPWPVLEMGFDVAGLISSVLAPSRARMVS